MFFCPDRLPEFDSYKNISISSELEQLLQRIIALVPQEFDPQLVVPKVVAYIKGEVKALPDQVSQIFLLIYKNV